jgi:hypothetical protein
MTVPLGVFLYSFAGVYHEQRGFGARCARYHILKKLDMSGSVYYNIISFLRLKKTPGGVYGNPLRALVLKSVQKKSVLERPGVTAAHFFDLLEFSVGQRSRVGQKPSYHGTFAVVYVSHYYYVHTLFGDF